MSWTKVVSNFVSGRIQNGIVEDGENHWWGGSLAGALSGMPGAGVKFNHAQAMSVATVYACTRARSEILASLPGMVFLELSENIRRRHSQNPLWQLLHDSPNPEMDSMVFYELLQTRVVNRGNGLAVIERNRADQPIALWPVHNSRVELCRDSQGELIWRIYSDYVDADLERVRYKDVPDRDMLNICGHGGNGYLSRGVMPVAVEEISLSMAMAKYGGSFFKSGAKPVGFVEHPKYIDDRTKRREFREDINRIHSGSENWNQIGVLWENAKFKEMQYSPEQSQFIASRGFSALEICRFYNVPPAVVQIFSDYKFSTVDAMIQQFVMTCVRSDAIRMERAINRQVVKTQSSKGALTSIFDDPYVFEFIIEALLRGDAKKQAETLEIERRNGIKNADEWRALNNQEPLPDKQGEKYLVPGGFEDLSTLGKTYPNGRKGETSSTSQLAGGPSFDREQVVASLEKGVPKHRDRSSGGKTSEATTVQAELDKAALVVLNEATGRLQSVLDKQLHRAGEDSAKVDTAWNDHCRRLESALTPGCEVYCQLREIEPGQLAQKLAAHLSAERNEQTITAETLEGCCDETDAG